MRQTVAVGIIKSVDKTDKTGGKGNTALYDHALRHRSSIHHSDKVGRESNQEEVIDVELLYFFLISFSYLVVYITGAPHTTTVIHTVFVFMSNALVEVLKYPTCSITINAMTLGHHAKPRGGNQIWSSLVLM